MTFCSEVPIKAVRKRRLCIGCEMFIEVGEAATSCAGKWDGEFWSGDYHAKCREAEVEMNREFIGVYSDEWVPLFEWRDVEAGPWLKDKFPDVYIWLCQTREQRAALAAAASGGDVKQAPAESPQSGGEAVTPNHPNQAD